MVGRSGILRSADEHRLWRHHSAFVQRNTAIREVSWMAEDPERIRSAGARQHVGVVENGPIARRQPVDRVGFVKSKDGDVLTFFAERSELSSSNGPHSFTR